MDRTRNLVYENNRLCLDGAVLEELARAYGTPLYLYSGEILRRGIREFQAAFAGVDCLVRYSCKANANLRLLEIMREAGLGADVISGGELALAMAAGFDPADVIMEGPGKSRVEMAGAVEAGVRLFSLESTREAELLEEIARRTNRKVTALLRLNPDIAAGGHHYINTGRKENKFGLTEEEVTGLVCARRDGRFLELGGLHMHLGSQIDSPAPYLKAVRKARDIHQSWPFRYLDLGGGFPVRYREKVPAIGAYGEALAGALAGLDVRLVLEPGRFLVAPCGFLLTRVVYRKDRPHRKFLVVDAGMNDLLRPSLYEAWHDIVPGRESTAGLETFDVVGPICESGDFLAKTRLLPGDFGEGDLLMVADAGAYGFAMASNYNGRPRPAEVLVDYGRPEVIRRRETIESMIALMKPETA